MSSFSRFRNPVLSRLFCSTAISTKQPSPSPKTAIINEILREKDPRKLAEKFKTSATLPGFRSHRYVYETAIRRLAFAKQFETIEYILEDQKKYINDKREGLATSLITLYGKSGMFDHALKVFEEMPERNCPRSVKSFNALLTAALDSKDYEKATELFDELPDELSVKPNIISYNILIQAYCKIGSLDDAFSVLGVMVKDDIKPDLTTFNTLLNGFYGGNRILDAEKIWAKMEEHNCTPDIISYNAKLRRLVSDGKLEEAVKFVDELRDKGLKPDVFSFNALMKGYCDDGNLEQAKKIYGDLERNVCNPNRWTFETLIPCCCEKGDFDMAIEVCEESMKRKCFIDVGILQAVIDGLVKESRVEDAKRLVEIGLSRIQYHSTLKLPSGAQ